MNPKYKPVELDKAQIKLWRETRTALVYQAPGFTHLFMTLMNPENNKRVAWFTRDVPIAATDGTCMLLNPDTFFSDIYTVMNRVFAGCHEVIHAMLNHPALLYKWSQQGHVTVDGIKLPFDENIAQIALDLVVNDWLVTSRIGKIYDGDADGNGKWYHWPHLVTHKMSVTEAYGIIYKAGQQGGNPGIPKPSPSGGQGQPQPGSPSPDTGNGNSSPQPAPGSFDKHLKPGEAQGRNPTTAAAERDEARWQREILAASELESQAGKGSSGASLMFKELLAPKVDWTDKLRALMHRKLGSDRWDWRVPDRRLMARDIYAPSRSGHGTGTIVIGVDTSGSVVNERDMFLAEVSGVLADMKPRKVVIVWCDDRVHDVDTCESAEDLNTIRRRGIRGSGGTSFTPVFEWVEKNHAEPDAVIYLTDGDGYGDNRGFPRVPPNYPVIWGSTVKQPKHYPFGEVVMVPRKQRTY